VIICRELPIWRPGMIYVLLEDVYALAFDVAQQLERRSA
jgi:hypothetical protein